MKDSKKTLNYSLCNILLPFLSIILFPLFLLFFVTFIGASITNKQITLMEVDFDFSKVNNYVYMSIIFVFLVITYRFFILGKIVREKTLYPGDLYGSYHWGWYKLAKITGYKHISLVAIPYHITLKILSTDSLKIIDNSNDEIMDKCQLYEDFEIIITDGDKEQVNIIISDTFPINDSSIPTKFTNYKTLFFNRKTKKLVRVFAKDFIDEIGKIMNEHREKGVKLNLFMTTSVSNTKYLFENYVLLKGRSFVHVEIFQMTNGPDRKFIENGITYKRGG